VNAQPAAAVRDQVHVEQLEVFARVGVTEQERSTPQRLRLNITVWPDTPFEELQDDIGRAVNYSAVCSEARRFMDDHAFRLVETLASELAAHLLGAFPISQVAIELRKYVVPDTEHVAVRLARQKDA
jgi:dihydroneopterin aldolase/2-amino-4-hydroxy-6-hydroxymethyldihydropteridine diphosphokinase